MRFLFVVSLVLTLNAFSQIPRTISFQGVLTDAQGNLVPDGNHQLQLTLYDQASGGNQVFVENQTVPVVKGIFNVIIGSVAPIPDVVRFDRAYFLGVRVDGGNELTPRTALTSVPYALRAERANVAETLSPNVTGVVTSVNNQSGALTFQGSGSTTITNNGNAFTISSTGTGGSGIQSLQNADGTISVQNPTGPTTTINIPDQAITPQKINPSGATNGQTLVYNGTNVQWQTVPGGGGVTSLNSLTGPITLAASGGATVSSIGNTITINAGSGSGGTGIQGIQNTDNALAITNPNGPTATINVNDQGIKTTMISDGAVTSGKIGAGQVVKSINSLKDDVTLSAGSNVTITPSGNTLTIASSGGTNNWTANGNNISNTNSGNVGIGTNNPATKLDVRGDLALEAGGSPTIYTSVANSEQNRYLQVINSPNAPTVSGLKAGGILVADDYSYYNPLPNHLIVKGFVGINAHTITPPAKLYILGDYFPGIYAESFGECIKAVSTSSNHSYSGVHGISNQSRGVTGDTQDYIGVAGIASGTSGIHYGILGNSNSPDGRAVFGYSVNPSGFSGYFDGKVHVNGTLSKSAGSFLIDHPLDPANKYLSHSFVESPDMMNIYNGVVTLDQNGEATITLPAYFEALNKDFRYQLTCLDAFAPVFISKRIQNNTFRVSGGKAGMEISWQVTGVRKDAYATAHPIIPETEKPLSERGTYLHAKELGFPEQLDMNYQSRQMMNDGMHESIRMRSEELAKKSEGQP